MGNEIFLFDRTITIQINNENAKIYIAAAIICFLLWMIYVCTNIERLRSRVNIYDRYFKAAGIVITRDDIEQMLKTKKSPGPTCAPGGPEDRLR